MVLSHDPGPLHALLPLLLLLAVLHPTGLEAFANAITALSLLTARP